MLIFTRSLTPPVKNYIGGRKSLLGIFWFKLILGAQKLEAHNAGNIF